MKRKWKWLVLAAVLVIGFATWLVVFSAGNVPIDVVGTLPEKDVTEIVALVKRKFRKEILPDFSWWSIRNSPAAYRRYGSIKLFTIIPVPDPEGVWVFIWSNTNFIRQSQPNQHYWSNKPGRPSMMGPQVLEATNAFKMFPSKKPGSWNLEMLWVE